MNPNDIAKKTDELVRKTISKLVQSILLSRVDVPPSQRFVNKTFHLELEESDIIQKSIDAIIFARNGSKVCFLLDIHFDDVSGSQRLDSNSLVESWRFNFEPLNLIDTNIELPKFYKNTIILIRTVYSMIRNLPCFTIFKNLTKIKQNSSSLKYNIRIHDQQSIYNPSFPINTSTKMFQFTPVSTPIGTLKFDISYRDNLRREIELSSQLGLESQFIIKDYNNNNFKPMMMNSNNNSNSNIGFGSTQPRNPSYTDLLNMKTPNNISSNNITINRTPNTSNPVSGSSGASSYGIDSYLTNYEMNNPIQIPRTNSNSNMYNIINNSGGIAKSNPINIGSAGSNIGSSGGGNSLGGPYSVSPPFSTSPPNYSKQQSPVYIGPHGSGNSPPFSSNPTPPPISSGPLPIRQVNFQIPNQPQSTSPQSANNPPFYINPQLQQTNRNRSISAPINIAQQQQQPYSTSQGGGQKSSITKQSPPFHVGVSPFKEPSSLDFYTKKGSSPSGGTTTTLNTNTLSSSFNSSGGQSNLQQRGESINSLKNSSISQIHGPLLVNNFSLKDINKTPTSTGTILDLIDNEEPVFAPSISSSKTTISEFDVSDFVKLCQLAPPLKIFDNNTNQQYHQHLQQHLQQLQLNNDIIELSNITFVNKSSSQTSPTVPTANSNNNNNNYINNTNPILNPPTYKATYQPSNYN